ncbi:MAG: hypothetical protein E7334_04175 [Clostridiales bacterium]|nr:hypothetical protein [Clostridiales bacterium]
MPNFGKYVIVIITKIFGVMMMSAILIAVIILLYSFQTLFCKLFTDRYPGKSELSSPVFCVIEGVFITLFTFAFNGFKFACAPLTLLLGVLNAAMLFGYNTSLIAAGKKGSFAFMNVCMLFGGIIVPSVYGVIWLSESMSALKLIGVAVMLVACVLMNLDEIKLKNTPAIYYVFCLLLFIFNGMYGTFVKMQSVWGPDQKQEMIMITFLIMGVIAFIELYSKEKKDTARAFTLNKKCIAPLVICLLSAALAINLLMFILPLIDTAVLYTIENGGVLILSAIYSVVLFKEKLRTPKLIGILLAVISITVLSI